MHGATMKIVYLSGFPNRNLLLKVYGSKCMISHLPHAYYKFFPSNLYMRLTIIHLRLMPKK